MRRRRRSNRRRRRVPISNFACSTGDDREVWSPTATALETISVDLESEIAELLSQTTDAPILVETRAVRYRVVREGADPFASYDPERAKAALNRVFGSLKGLHVDEFLAEIK